MSRRRRERSGRPAAIGPSLTLAAAGGSQPEPHAIQRAFVLLAAISMLSACPGGSSPADVPGVEDGGADTAGAPAADAAAADAAAADAAACVPLASVSAEICPPTWAAAMADNGAFCAHQGKQPGFAAFLSTEVCGGFLHYDRQLFDAGPRACLYDPATLALRGYRAQDPKAGFSAITCGSAPADFDDRTCKAATCSRDTPSLPACRWPASLDAADAGTGACRPARAFLSCAADNGTTELCLSNDPTQCPGPNAQPGVTYTCHDQCEANEYGLACGAIGVGLTGPPPEGCRSVNPTPGGVDFYCCPCGS
jgi:hypothetical protein